MECYLDNSATTRCLDSAAALMAGILCTDYGNPSSLHHKGVQAEEYVRHAREVIAKTLKVTPKEIFFTSGGTESNNLAIRGVCAAGRGRHILTTPLEHPATMNTLSHLRKKGWRVDAVPVQSDGVISLSALEKMVTADTVLLTAMLVNNEIGSIQPIAKMAKILKKKNPRAVFHVDAVQGYGKVLCDVRELGVDLLSISGHKIHGPKGIGVLYIKKGTKIAPILYGGGQQDNLRSGTENVPGIAGLGLAAEICHKNMKESVPKMERLRRRLEQGIVDNIPDVRINTPGECAPHILNVSFGGVRSEVVLHSLENEGIYVSSGSACSSHKKEPSYVLTAIGTPREMIDGSIRFSLSEMNTEEDIDAAVAALTAIVPRLRKLNLS